MHEPTRLVAVDWSGDRNNDRRKIWLAEANRHGLTRLENGRGRLDLARLVIDESKRDHRLIIGFDFAFSFPRWFCEGIDANHAVDVWARAALEGEAWLRSCAAPFWGRPGTRCPQEGRRFRTTEEDLARSLGIRPKSVFQVGGAGAVGTGSIRGMPILKLLHEAGFAVWPFDPPGRPLVVEIYPRALTGPVNKSSHADRLAYLKAHFPALSRRWTTIAASCEDAFDAAVSALVMYRRGDELTHLPGTTDPCHLLEGRIWR
jgi:hypothetical protein